jgi:hypothetical protein
VSDCFLCELAKKPTDTHTWVRNTVSTVTGRKLPWVCIVCGKQSWQQRPESFKTCKRVLMEAALE